MRLERFEGCWTAIVTPMLPNGDVDYRGLEKNVAFQTSHGVNLVPTGTTGESPTLDWDEHERVIGETIRFAGGKVFVMAGTGSNSTREALRATEHAVEMGVDAVLLVDCYYNGPSSLELRKEWSITLPSPRGSPGSLSLLTLFQAGQVHTWKSRISRFLTVTIVT